MRIAKLQPGAEFYRPENMEKVFFRIIIFLKVNIGATQGDKQSYPSS